MAGDLRGFALQKAELLSGRLREMLSSGQGYLLTRFGLDLGLEPELYPTWVVLSTAAVGLLLVLLLAVSWAAVCGGLLTGKRRRSPAERGVCEPPVKAILTKSVKAEEPQQQQQQPKKKSKKKAADKVTRRNRACFTMVRTNQARLFIVVPRTRRTLLPGYPSLAFSQHCSFFFLPFVLTNVVCRPWTFSASVDASWPLC